jgi:hypothetical protein
LTGRRTKSFFASFFSKKEDCALPRRGGSSFSEEKEAKRLLFLVLRSVACRAIRSYFGERGKGPVLVLFTKKAQKSLLGPRKR